MLEMKHVLRFLRVFALGTWVGAIFYFSAAVAPGAFRVLSGADQAGLLVEFTLRRLHYLGLIAGLVFLFASLVAAVSSTGTRKGLLLPAIGVLLMVALTIISQHVVIRHMAQLRRDMVSVAGTPANDPRRVEFDRLHGISVDFEGAVLLIGFVALFLTVREQAS